jgi:hypothetical protein
MPAKTLPLHFTVIQENVDAYSRHVIHKNLISVMWHTVQTVLHINNNQEELHVPE